MAISSRSGLATLLLGAASALVVLACGDSTGSRSPSDAKVTVSVVSVHEPAYSYTSDGVALIECLVDLKAAVQGAGIRWRDATFRWYLDKELTQPFDSAVVDATTIQNSWGEPEMDPGGTATSGWFLNASVPFTATVQYRFVDTEGASGSTVSAPASCRPPTPPNPAPLVLRSPVVSPNTEVEPGGQLQVEYTASSGAGLWQTIVQLSGACDTLLFIPEQLQPSVTRQVSLQLPHTCAHGQDLNVRVQAIDALVRFDAAQSPGVPVVDRTPPTLDLHIFHPEYSDYTRDLTGTYFGRDTIIALSMAKDNGEVRTLHWSLQPGNVQDSLPVFSGPGGTTPIVIPKSLDGAYQLSVYVTDEAGLQSPTISSAPGAFTVHPTVDRPTVIRTINGDCRDGVIDEARGRVYVLQGNISLLTILSLSTLANQGTVQLPQGATGLELSEGGDSLLLAIPFSDSYGVIDLRAATPQVVVVPLTVGHVTGFTFDWKIVTMVGGKMFIYRADETGPTIQVDLTTGAQSVRSNLFSGGMVRSLDRTSAVLGVHGGLSVYDGVNDQVITQGLVSPSGFVGMDRTGSRIAVQMKIYNRSLQLVREIPHTFGASVPVSTISADGSHLLWQYGGYLMRSPAVAGDSEDRIELPSSPDFYRLSPSGNFLLSLNGSGRPQSTAAVVDLR